MSGVTWGKLIECPQCRDSFEGEMLWPYDIFPNGPRMCCSGQDCACYGMPVDLPWFECPNCGHWFEMTLVEIPKPSGTLADIALPQHCACGQLLQDLQELERHVECGCWRAM